MHLPCCMIFFNLLLTKVAKFVILFLFFHFLFNSPQKLTAHFVLLYQTLKKNLQFKFTFIKNPF